MLRAICKPAYCIRTPEGNISGYYNDKPGLPEGSEQY